MTSFSLLFIVIFLTLTFEFSNGWHDAANSIATVVSTRVLTPFRAVAWAAFWNFIAAFVFGTAVASTIGKGMIRIELIPRSHWRLRRRRRRTLRVQGAHPRWLDQASHLHLPLAGRGHDSRHHLDPHHQLDCAPSASPESRPLVPPLAVAFCGPLQPRPRYK